MKGALAIFLLGYYGAIAFVTWALWTHGHIVWACIFCAVFAMGVSVKWVES